MANTIGTKNLYIVVTLVFLGFFGYDLYKVFTSLDSAEESLRTNKYATKIEETKKLIKVFDKPLFESSFLNDFKSYGTWPLDGSARSRGAEIFTLPETSAEQLLDLKKDSGQINPQPTIPVKK